MVDKKSKTKKKPKQKPVEKENNEKLGPVSLSFVDNMSQDIDDTRQALNTMAKNVHEAFQDVYDKLSELNIKVNKVSDRLGL
tara:strand:+ start:108 stop:353 length:246 start_codon:yes stop_codon:yes gene_type:complete